MKKPSQAIIDRVESRLAKHIIDTAICLEGCKCDSCFHKYLDAAVKFSDSVTPQTPETFEIERFIN